MHLFSEKLKLLPRSAALVLFRALVLVLVLGPQFGLAHEGSHASDEPTSAGRVLGDISFPTASDSAPAQAAFIEGMLLLHLFEYPFAEAAFQRAQSLDPDFAMAYWGEAMVHNHPIWDQQNREKAWAVLTRFAPSIDAINARLRSDKERDFFASLFILYGPQGDSPSKAERDLAYERHYAAMATRYPDDPEVQLFYALSLMGTHAGVRDVTAYMEATAIAQRVFSGNPRHPGAAHYLIHGVDDPTHAPLGLDAARALYRLAPDAGHSLHMTSHIFIALGMWDDVVEANFNAVRVANTMRAERGLAPTGVGHYNLWLIYGLLQQERIPEAKAMLMAAYNEVTALGVGPNNPLDLGADGDPVTSLVEMWTRFMLETGGSDATIAGWSFNTGNAFDPRLNIHYVKGLLSRDSKSIGSHLTAFRELKSDLEAQIKAQPRQAPSDLLYLRRLAVIEQELLATLALAESDTDKALSFAREASRLEGDMPYSFGPPFVDYPAAQLLGELATLHGSRSEATAAFREQLKRSRNRRQAVAGLAVH